MEETKCTCTEPYFDREFGNWLPGDVCDNCAALEDEGDVC